MASQRILTRAMTTVCLGSPLLYTLEGNEGSSWKGGCDQALKREEKKGRSWVSPGYCAISI